MKDLELKDILDRKDTPLTRITVYFNGKWSFANLSSPTKYTEDQNFYLINYPFGLTKSNVLNPAHFSVKGDPGDYVSLDRQGALALVTASNYALLFPGPQEIPTPPPSSEQLRDPNFLTKIQLESVDKDSDKVLIGDREFSLPSTQKKTITIIETPTGQSQVYTDASGGAVIYDYSSKSGGVIEVDVPDKPY